MSYCVLQECGADCAKFQKSELEFKFNRKALERPYTSKHSWGSTYGEHKRHLEFSHAQYRELQRYAQEIGIFFTASGMDEVSAQPLMGCRQLWWTAGSSSAHRNCVQLSGKPMGRWPGEGVLREEYHGLKTTPTSEQLCSTPASFPPRDSQAGQGSPIGVWFRWGTSVPHQPAVTGSQECSWHHPQGSVSGWLC